jgi:hypothetical protein
MDVPKKKWESGGSTSGPRSADGQRPTHTAPLSAWTVQPKGRRSQAKARAGTSAAAAVSATPVEEVSDMEKDGDDVVMAEAVVPSIAALEAELKHLQSAPATDEALAPIILAKTAQIQLRRDSQRSSKFGWQQERDLDRKIGRARLQRKLAGREAELALEISGLQKEGARVCEEAREVDLRISLLETEVAAVAARTAAASGVCADTPLATLAALAAAHAGAHEFDAIVNSAVEAFRT